MCVDKEKIKKDVAEKIESEVEIDDVKPKTLRERLPEGHKTNKNKFNEAPKVQKQKKRILNDVIQEWSDRCQVWIKSLRKEDYININNTLFNLSWGMIKSFRPQVFSKDQGSLRPHPRNLNFRRKKIFCWKICVLRVL